MAFLPTLNIEGPIVWKSDTEGFDPEIVASVDHSLWSRVEVAAIEVWPARMDSIYTHTFLERACEFDHLEICGVGTLSPNELKALLGDPSVEHYDLLAARNRT